MDWNYLKVRRRLNLADFVAGAKNEIEALLLFEKRGVTNPPLDEIRQLFKQTVADETFTNDVSHETKKGASHQKKAKAHDDAIRN